MSNFLYKNYVLKFMDSQLINRLPALEKGSQAIHNIEKCRPGTSNFIVI